VPWTHGRLSYHSGYGAGIESPGWYEHLWSAGDQAAIRWMTRVARLLREEDLDASSAHVIESIRLAEALAALRDRPVPGLAELNEATQSILLFGDATPMALIHNKLIVGEVMGEVPDETPMVPLQKDLVREQRRLRMSPEALQKTLDLDLRNATDLERSYLLHRLNLLHLPWGQGARGSGKGTFHEIWTLQWQPEFAVALIEAAIWGHTVAEAATARTCDLADRAPDLPSVTTLLNQAMLANLPVAVEHLMACIQAKAAVAGDVTQLMAALPPLVNVARYGNVRRTDAEMVSGVIDGLVTRIAIGLPLACASLNDEAAAAMLGQMVAVDEAIRRSQNEGHLAQWQEALVRIADRAGVHGLVAGRSCRLLLDQNVFSVEETARRMGLALSAASDPAQAAAWVDGLLRGAGLVLLLNDALWEALDEWVSLLPAGVFPQLLPLLRRTFSTFAPAERRQMGERVRSGAARPKAISALASDFNPERADRVLPLAARLLGVALPGEASHA